MTLKYQQILQKHNSTPTFGDSASAESKDTPSRIDDAVMIAMTAQHQALQRDDAVQQKLVNSAAAQAEALHENEEMKTQELSGSTQNLTPSDAQKALIQSVFDLHAVIFPTLNRSGGAQTDTLCIVTATGRNKRLPRRSHCAPRDRRSKGRTRSDARGS